jgi:hypothetical protein
VELENAEQCHSVEYFRREASPGLFRVEYIIEPTNENMVEFVGVGLFVKSIDGNDIRLESKGQKRNTK